MHKRRQKTKKKCTKRQKMRGVLRVRDEGKREKRVRDEAKVERQTTSGKRRSRRQSALVPFQSAMRNKMKIEKKQNTIFCTGNCC